LSSKCHDMFSNHQFTNLKLLSKINRTLLKTKTLSTSLFPKAIETLVRFLTLKSFIDNQLGRYTLSTFSAVKFNYSSTFFSNNYESLFLAIFNNIFPNHDLEANIWRFAQNKSDNHIGWKTLFTLPSFCFLTKVSLNMGL